MKNKSMLIIGVGFVGAELFSLAQENGWTVYGVTKSGGDGNFATDVSSAESLEGLKNEIGAVDVVVHCASSGRGGAEAYERVFFQGVSNLKAIFHESHLIFVSSSSVYAQINGERVTEESEAAPDRDTGKILRRSEEVVLSHQGSVARLAGIYGKGRSVLIKKILTDTAVVEEDGRRIVNQIHHEDAATALLFIAENPEKARAQVFNVSDSHPRSQKETYLGLSALFSKEMPPTGPRNENKKRGWTHKAVSNQKLKALGWQLKYDDFLETAVTIAPTLELG